MNTMKLTAHALLLAGLCGVFACEKSAEDVARPAHAKTASASVLEDGYGDDESWNKFVEQVELGERVDPLGQFLKKDLAIQDSTIIEREAPLDEREPIPKYTAEERNAQLLKMVESGEIKEEDVVYASKNYGYQFESSVGRGLPSFFSWFTSTERRTQMSYNPGDNIYDLKIVKGGRAPLPYYTYLNVDLNRGAGGQHIYLAFTRYVRKTQYDGSDSQRGVVRDLTAVTQRVGAVFTSRPTNFVPTFTDYSCSVTANNANRCFKEGDLNDGAGGRFVYGYQSKLTQMGNPIEVGVVSGNGDVQPPTGWVRVGPDLNEKAGGAYVYFCIRR